MPIISGKEALAFTEQVQKLIAIADFELQKFGWPVQQNGSITDYTDLFKESA